MPVESELAGAREAEAVPPTLTTAAAGSVPEMSEDIDLESSLTDASANKGGEAKKGKERSPTTAEHLWDRAFKWPFVGGPRLGPRRNPWGRGLTLPESRISTARRPLTGPPVQPMDSGVCRGMPAGQTTNTRTRDALPPHSGWHEAL